MWIRHLEGTALNQFTATILLVKTSHVHSLHLLFTALPLCKEQFQGAIKWGKTLRTLPISRSKILICNKTLICEWMRFLWFKVWQIHQAWEHFLPDMRTRTSIPRTLELQETPEDGDMSTETCSELPRKELGRRQCKEANVLRDYYKPKWTELIAGLMLF